MMIGVAVEPILEGLDRDSTAMPFIASLDTSVNEASAILDVTPLMVSKLGLYCNVKMPEVTPRPLDKAMGMPLPGMLLGTLMVARVMETPGVLELSNWPVDWASALWKVTNT